MKNLEEIKLLLAKRKQELRDKYNVKSIGIFGSVVRGDNMETSDVDILVEFEAPIGLDFVELADYLENLMGVKVDLVSKGAVKRKQKLWDSIREDLVYV